MALPQPEITCLCAQKTLIFEDRERAQQAQAQHLADSFAQLGLAGESFILPGGGVVARGTAVCEAAGCCAALVGRIDNKAALVERYLTKEASGSPRNGSSVTLLDADLVCRLYKLFGRMVPQKLRGSFTFILFDPAQGRVLAAVSPSSPIRLVQARTAENDLLVTSQRSQRLPSGSHMQMEIPAGFMKYGWSSEPQRYAVVQEAAGGHPQPAAIAAAAARKALQGLEPAYEGAAAMAPGSPESGAEGLDSEGREEPQSPVPKKTRRGKRAGKNQKLRAEQIMLQRLSSDTRRPSLDVLKATSALSFSSTPSRADEQSWWRTNTPRTSLDARGFAARLSTQSDRVITDSRRSGMSPTAPAFVPGAFSRQSVPPLKSQTSAISLAGVPSCFSSGGSRSTTILSPGMHQGGAEEMPGASPFEGQPLERQPGKADAAWEEESHLPRRLPQDSADDHREGSAEAGTPDSSAAKLPAEMPASTPQAGEATVPCARIKVKASEAVKGASPDGSPHRPPRGPAALKYLFKAIRKRPSQTDIRLATAGATAQASASGRSSSHGNLVSLAEPRMENSRNAEKAWLALEAHQRSASSDFKQATTSSAGQQAAMGARAGLTASWLARTTRSVFSKSKSCTSLVDIDRPALQSPPLGGVRAA